MLTEVYETDAPGRSRPPHTGGIWVPGSGAELTETSPQDPSAITAWRGAIEQRVLDAEGVKTTLIMPGIVYGYGQGIPNMLVQAPRTTVVSGETGAAGESSLTLIGSGDQHWSTVFVDDLAELYILAFDEAATGSVYLGAGGENPTVRQLGEAAATAAGLEGRVSPSTDEETYEMLGRPFAERCCSTNCAPAPTRPDAIPLSSRSTEKCRQTAAIATFSVNRCGERGGWGGRRAASGAGRETTALQRLGGRGRRRMPVSITCGSAATHKRIQPSP